MINLTSDENEFDEVIENTTSLIGTHDERSALLHEQDTPTGLLAPNAPREVPAAEERDDSINESMGDSWYVFLL